jgi:chemotaxis protein MotC
MIARRLAIAFAFFGMLAAGAVKADEGDVSPLQLLTDLQNLQLRIAQGDAAAFAAQPAALHDMAGAFAAAKPEVWKDPANLHAAVAFVLSGGSPHVIAPLLDIEGLSKQDDALLRGALAYLVGRSEDAQRLLGGLDARSLDLRLAGQIAFIQSVLITAKDKKKATELLDQARLLAPGGLVEEAALRREIFLVGDLKDSDRFVRLSRQYIDRCPKSMYAEGFLKSLPPIIARYRLAEDLIDFQKFESLAESLSSTTRRGLFLAVARAALVDGKVQTADVAARLALLLVPPDSSDEARGKLYGAAARMFVGDYDRSLTELSQVNVKKLSPRDVALLGATREMAKRLRDVPDAAAAPPASANAASDKNNDDDAMATIRLAETTVAQSNDFLAVKKP